MNEIRLGGVTYRRDANRVWRWEEVDVDARTTETGEVRDDLARALDLIEHLQAAAEEQRR